MPCCIMISDDRDGDSRSVHTGCVFDASIYLSLERCVVACDAAPIDVQECNALDNTQRIHCGFSLNGCRVASCILPLTSARMQPMMNPVCTWFRPVFFAISDSRAGLYPLNIIPCAGFPNAPSFPARRFQLRENTSLPVHDQGPQGERLVSWILGKISAPTDPRKFDFLTLSA